MGRILDSRVLGLTSGEFDAAGGDHGFCKAAGGGDGEGAVFEAFDEAVDLRGGEDGAGLVVGDGFEGEEFFGEAARKGEVLSSEF